MMRGPKRRRFGPRFEGGAVLPHRVGRIERMILRFGAFKQMEFDEAGHLIEMSVARQPDFLEGCFGALGHAEPVHGNEHQTISGLSEASFRSRNSGYWRAPHIS